MSDYPNLAVILLTYARTDYAERTITALRRNLAYPGNVAWYVADDGSEQAHMERVAYAMAGAPMIGWHTQRIGYGASANKAFDAAYQFASVALFIEDDWELKRTYDPTQHIHALETVAELGMIRLGHLAVGLDMHSVGYHGVHYLRISFDSSYCFSGNPHLRHKRAWEAWGPYPTGLKPGETEVAYDAQVRAKRGPAVLWPPDIGGWGLFGHIGERKSYD